VSADAVPAVAGAVDVPHGELVELSARFAHAYLRWLATSTSDGLSYPGMRLLETLHCQGPAKMRELADGLGLSARNMTALADTLEAEGLVQRVAHPSDRRATLLELSEAGFAAADQSLAPRLTAISRIFDQLPSSQRACLTEALIALVDALEPGTGRPTG
jgi:DNA-binding MarR family transcriptional regulator